MLGGMKKTISSILEDAATLKHSLASNSDFVASVEKVALKCSEVVNSGGTIFACGNGGSTCDAMHFTEELVARYKRERRGIRAMHLMDGPTITCWSNDYSFKTAYRRQIETFCNPNDILFGISTSGKSDNIIEAVHAAKAIGATTVALTGKSGEPLKSLTDYSILVPCNETERIQEAHITVIHILCELIETSPTFR